MNPTINRLKIIFLVIFAIGCAALWAYQIFWVWPAKRCDENGAWWDRQTRICAQPIYIPSITGRPEGVSRLEWSKIQAAKQVQRDSEGYPTGEDAPAETPPAAAAPKGSAAAATAPVPLPAKK